MVGTFTIPQKKKILSVVFEGNTIIISRAKRNLKVKEMIDC